MSYISYVRICDQNTSQIFIVNIFFSSKLRTIYTVLMFTSPSGRFTLSEEAHRTHWIWCWLGLRPIRKALEEETSLLTAENWKKIAWSSIT